MKLESQQGVSLAALLQSSASYSPNEQDLITSRNELWAACTYILESLLEGQASSLMNSLVIGTHVPIGARLLATKWVVDPAQAAFQHTLLMSWNGRAKAYYGGQDFLVIWASVISMADYLSRKRFVRGQEFITLKEVFTLIAQLRHLYVAIKMQWSDPSHNRWILKLLTGAACLMLMNKPQASILSLWNHLTLAGMGLPYPQGAIQESAWAEGLDLHQTIMAAYSVVQTNSLFDCDLGGLIESTSSAQRCAITLVPTEEEASIQKELAQMISLAKSHPDLGHCESLLTLKNRALWDKGLSWLLSNCAL